jgi:hypothetical protein
VNNLGKSEVRLTEEDLKKLQQSALEAEHQLDGLLGNGLSEGSDYAVSEEESKNDLSSNQSVHNEEERISTDSLVDSLVGFPNYSPKRKTFD